MIFGAIRGVIASSVIFPLGWVILGSGFVVRDDRILVLIGMVLLTGCVGSTIGLLMGTVIKPDQISLMFTLIFTPLLFTGCTYYPWGALSNIRWFQLLTLFNPLIMRRRDCAIQWCRRLADTIFRRWGSAGFCCCLGFRW